MRALLILNERSRRGKRFGARVCRELEAHGMHCERNPEARAVDAVIAAGGDGTIVHALPLALQRGVPLGIVPLGTFNDLARTLDIPLEIAESCAAIAGGKRVRIDLGVVNGVYFVNEASVGISSRAARRQRPEIKQRFGALAVLWSAIAALRRARPFSVTLRSDGSERRLRTVQLTVANSARFGGLFQRDDAAIDDGWLDLYSIETASWLQGLRVLIKALRGDASPGAGLCTIRSKRFEVLTDCPHHVTADGEPAGMTPAVFEIRTQALDVFVA